MSRVGKLPVSIPEGVTVIITDNNVMVKGPKGELNLKIKKNIKVELIDNQVWVKRSSEEKKVKSLHGTIRNLINNMVLGVTKEFTKTLKLIGTGYRVKLMGKNLEFTLGFSHPIIVEAVPGIDFKVDGQDLIIISGADKHMVGQVAANIRALKTPEPYKGKGIRYIDEQIIKKAGKTSKGE